MKVIKFYQYTIGVLVLLNIGILAFFFLTKPKHPRPAPHNNFQTEVIQTLHLSVEQADFFRKMANQHHENMVSIDKQQQELLLPYFQNLSDTNIQVDEEKILSDFQRLEKEKITVTHKHFKELKSILEKNQLPYFKQITNKFIQNVILQNKKTTRLPKDFK